MGAKALRRPLLAVGHRAVCALGVGLAVAGAAAGCGGASPSPGRGKPSTITTSSSSVVHATRFSPPCLPAVSPGAFTAEQVAARFLQLTGERLTVKHSVGLEFLDLPETAFARTSGRYGQFQITVVNGGLTDIETQLDHDQAGDTVNPDQGCVWWQRDHASPPDWQAVKPFGNVLLTVDYHSIKHLDANFQRLVEVLDTLRDPPAVAASRIPALDVACDKRGITPGSSIEGSCRLGDQTLVQVGAKHLLRLPGIDVRLDSVQTGARIDVAGRGVIRSRGGFVIVRYTVTNHTSAPISDLDPDARLAIDSRLYRNRPGLEVLFTPPAAPGLVNPGGSLQEVRVFDLPLAAIRRLDAAAALEVAGDHQLVLVGDSDTVGRLRLRGAPRQGSGPTSSRLGTRV